jgi:hypothetical protein
VPDKEKCEAFLRAQKTLAEKNRTKGVSPTAVFRSPSRRKAAKQLQTCYVPFVRTLYFYRFNEFFIFLLRKKYIYKPVTNW